MELKQSDYERLGRIYGLERDIETLTAEFAKVKSKFRADRNAILDNISAVKKEIASPAETPELPLAAGNETENGRNGESASPDTEEQRLADEINRKTSKKTGKTKKDTMAVERTLITVFPVCDEVKNGEFIGCCQCDALCSEKITGFGNAAACSSTVACSKDCPKAIRKEDIEDKSEEALFHKAQEWYGNTPLKQVSTSSGRPIVQQLTVSDLMKHLNCSRDLTTRLYDRIIYEKYKTLEEKKATDKNVCATYDKDLANAAKAPLMIFTVYKLDLENKKIFSYDSGKNKFILDGNCISKAATLREFKHLQENKAGFLDIDRITTWTAKPGLDQFILFQGDYHGAVYDQKQLRFIRPGMKGWGKHQKFSNLEQYNEALAGYRKDSTYLEA